MSYFAESGTTQMIDGSSNDFKNYPFKKVRNVGRYLLVYGDAATAIQNAINDAVNLNQDVFIPGGSYNISRTISIIDNDANGNQRGVNLYGEFNGAQGGDISTQLLWTGNNSSPMFSIKSRENCISNLYIGATASLFCVFDVDNPTGAGANVATSNQFTNIFIDGTNSYTGTGLTITNTSPNISSGTNFFLNDPVYRFITVTEFTALSCSFYGGLYTYTDQKNAVLASNAGFSRGDAIARITKILYGFRYGLTAASNCDLMRHTKVVAQHCGVGVYVASTNGQCKHFLFETHCGFNNCHFGIYFTSGNFKSFNTSASANSFCAFVHGQATENIIISGSDCELNYKFLDTYGGSGNVTPIILMGNRITGNNNTYTFPIMTRQGGPLLMLNNFLTFSGYKAGIQVFARNGASPYSAGVVSIGNVYPNDDPFYRAATDSRVTSIGDTGYNSGGTIVQIPMKHGRAGLNSSEVFIESATVDLSLSTKQTIFDSGGRSFIPTRLVFSGASASLATGTLTAGFDASASNVVGTPIVLSFLTAAGLALVVPITQSLKGSGVFGVKTAATQAATVQCDVYGIII